MVYFNFSTIKLCFWLVTILSKYRFKIEESNHLSEFANSLKENAGLHDPDIKLCVKKKKAPEKAEIIEMILYESVLPISSFIFLTEINNMTESEVNEFCDDIIFESMKVIYVTKNIGNNCKNEAEENEEDLRKSNLVGSKDGNSSDLDILNDSDKEIEQKSEERDIDTDQSKFTSGEEKLEKQMDDALQNMTDVKPQVDIIKIDENPYSINDRLHENPPVNENDKDINVDTKKEILELLNLFSNFSLELDVKNPKLKKALEKRNECFEEDKSQIAKMLYFEKLREIKGFINKISNEDIKNMIGIKNIHHKNDKYRRMIKALRRAVIETENLAKALEREKREFIREFSTKTVIPENKEMFDLKIAFNLGGSIFAPGVFLQVAQNIIMSQKDTIIEKAVTTILNPIESLELYIRHKSNTEKKEEIIKFLLACMEKRNNIFFDEIDEAFKARSVLLDLYLRNQITCTINIKTNTCELRNSRERAIDKYQENFIQNMIKKIKDVNEDSLERFVIINRDIVAAYKKLLRTRSKSSKIELLKIFQKRKN